MSPMDLSGAWWGQYRYLTGRAVGFWAILDDSGGAFTGTSSEPNRIGDTTDLLHAVLRGTREGSAVRFVKAYDGASDAAHAVDYAGTLDRSGERIAGEWRLSTARGSFEMRRTLPDADEEAVERRETADTRA